MLRKKLLTIGCVLGILACGACFGPLSNKPAPPPPPPLRPLGGVHTIRVTVSNTAESHHIDPSKFGRAVISVINSSNQPTEGRSGLHGISANDPGSADAILAVTILAEDAHRVHQHDLFSLPGWKVSVTSSATLTANDGRVLWSDSSFTNTRIYYTNGASDKGAAFDWDTTIENGIELFRMTDRMVEEMIYVKSKN
jgi:hypothetical protein